MNKTPSLPLLFLAVRLALFLSLPLEGLAGYGDLGHFYGWAQLAGWPFLDYWMEFPPLFPFLGELLYRLAGGREQAFFYLLAFLFSAAQAGSLALFLRIAKKMGLAESRAWVYFGLLAGLFYGWTYFDPLAVFALLLGLWWALEGRELRAGLAFGLGALVKWFPLLGLAVLARKGNRLQVRPLLAALGVVVLAWLPLLAASPDYTMASLRSQEAKGSWETVWALLDGNPGTGNFGAKEARYDPASALEPQGNPARIPPWLALLPFAALGLWAWLRSDLERPRSLVAFSGLALALFFLWSPGWSPQWVLYLLPIVLLALPGRTGVLFAGLLVLVNLLEWPLLLSRGLFELLPMTVLLRTLLLVLLAWEFWRIIPRANTASQTVEIS